MYVESIQQPEYTNMFSESIKTAVRGAITAEATNTKKWQAVGMIVRDELTKEKFDEVKAAFVAEVVVPAMGDGAIKAFKVDLPRKGTTVYKEACAKTAGYAEQWDAANEAKNSVKRMASTYRARIGEFAWPTAKAEPVPRSLVTRFNEEITALIKAGEKSEEEPFNIAAVIDLLTDALKLVNK